MFGFVRKILGSEICRVDQHTIFIEFLQHCAVLDDLHKNNILAKKNRAAVLNARGRIYLIELCNK